MSTPSIRVDKWLWHARFFKTRTIAQNVVTSGKVRINAERISKANHIVKPGDVLTFVRGKQVCVIEILAISTRRGPAPEAQTLYTDLSPPPALTAKDDPGIPAPVARREPGTGRPTKQERRKIDQLRRNSD